MAHAHVGVVAKPQSAIGFSYYRAVTVDNTGGPARTNYPVRISLTSSNFTFANALSTGYDIQFRNNAGSLVLPHWRETYDNGAQTADIWVRVDELAANTTTTIGLYYGYASAVDRSSIAEVFSFGEDFRLTEVAANSMSGSVAGSVPPIIGNALARDCEIAIHGGTGWRQTEVREQSNIVWTGSEYVILVTGRSGANDCSTGLYYASTITGPWTDYASNPVLPLAEDSYICVTTDGDLYTDGSGWHYVMFERKTAGSVGSQNDVGTARTKNFRTDWEVWNGSAWTTTVANHVATLVRGASGAFDDQDTASPVLMHDGSQFIVVYEGQKTTGVDATGIARSSDAITWTKEATNPISTLDVPDDIVNIDGVWWMTGHGSTGNQYRLTASGAPATWTSSSFTYSPSSPIDSNGNSINMAFGFDGAEKWCTYQDGIGTYGIKLFNFLGGSKWKSTILYPSSSTGRQYLDEQGVSTSALQLQHGGQVSSLVAGRWAAVVWSASNFGLASDFAVIARKRQTVNASGDDQYSLTAGIGTGTPVLDATIGYASFPDGYVFAVLNPDEFGCVVREYTAGALVDNVVAANTVTTADASTYYTHEMRYRSNGDIAYLINGTSRGTGNDTTHLAATKSLMLGQGNGSGRPGGLTEWEWVAVRKYDGADPSVSVGAEAGSFSATGGTITSSGGYTIHTFTSSGTFEIVSGTKDVEYLVVAGGGGGGNSGNASRNGGGGGAGGMTSGTFTSMTVGTYPVVVGAGGASATNGSDSSVNSITATGGGKGGPATLAGSTGGSGGGAGGRSSQVTGAAGTSGQGSAGGANTDTGTTLANKGAGGGGKGAVGADGGAANSGNGGAGSASSISGSSVTYAGGGGGGANTTPGTGGAGGGGAGSGTSGVAGTAGTANTGGGGGGACGVAAGGAGGSGIVIVRYLT